MSVSLDKSPLTVFPLFLVLNGLSFSSSHQEHENTLLIKLLSIDYIIKDINHLTVELLQWYLD